MSVYSAPVNLVTGFVGCLGDVGNGKACDKGRAINARAVSLALVISVPLHTLSLH